MLDGIEVAVVVVGDLRGDIALADAIDVVRGDVERPDDGIEGVVHPCDDLLEVALVLARVRASGELPVHRGRGEHRGVGDECVDRLDAGIEVVLDGVEVTVVVVGNLRGDIALADVVDVVRGDIQRTDDRVQGVVDAFDDLLEVALVLARVRAGGELPVHRGRGEHRGVVDERVDRLDAGIEVVLDGVEVTIVVVSDLRRDIALADAVDVVRGDAERPDDRVEGVVDAFDDLAEVALVLGRIRAGGELSLHRGRGEHRRVRDHLPDGGHAEAQRLADGVEGLMRLARVGVPVGDRDGELEVALRQLSEGLRELLVVVRLEGVSLRGPVGLAQPFDVQRHEAPDDTERGQLLRGGLLRLAGEEVHRPENSIADGDRQGETKLDAFVVRRCAQGAVRKLIERGREADVPLLPGTAREPLALAKLRRQGDPLEGLVDGSAVRAELQDALAAVQRGVRAVGPVEGRAGRVERRLERALQGIRVFHTRDERQNGPGARCAVIERAARGSLPL